VQAITLLSLGMFLCGVVGVRLIYTQGEMSSSNSSSPFKVGTRIEIDRKKEFMYVTGVANDMDGGYSEIKKIRSKALLSEQLASAVTGGSKGAIKSICNHSGAPRQPEKVGKNRSTPRSSVFGHGKCQTIQICFLIRTSNTGIAGMTRSRG
jgi:hypothetical protein